MREARVSVGEDGFDSMGIEGLVSLCRAAGIREFEELACRGNGAVVQVTTEARIEERGLDELDCVDEWNRVADTDDGHVYVVSFTAPELPEHLAETADDLVGTCDPEVSDRGATMSLVGPQDAIAGTIREYESAGVAAELHRLGSYDGRDRPLDELTDRQREVIQTAFDAGYYEVPREASTADVAADLDLDPSTVAEHLRRAERNLLEPHLARE